jgi:hypothetical protein
MFWYKLIRLQGEVFRLFLKKELFKQEKNKIFYKSNFIIYMKQRISRNIKIQFSKYFIFNILHLF